MNSKLRQELDKPVVKYGVVIVAAIVVLQYILLPWLEWREEKRTTLSREARLIVDEDVLETASESLTGKLALLEKQEEELRSFFPELKGSPSVELPSVVRGEAEQFGLEINRVAITELQSDKISTQTYALSLEATGSADKAFAFVNSLETQKDFFIVERFTLYNPSRDNLRIRMELVKHVQN